MHEREATVYQLQTHVNLVIYSISHVPCCIKVYLGHYDKGPKHSL